MTRARTRKIELRRQEVEDLLDALEKEAQDRQRALELDARLLGKLHTFYGESYGVSDPTLISGAFRRSQDIMRGL